MEMIAEASEQSRRSTPIADLEMSRPETFSELVVVIEKRTLIRECLALCLQKSLARPVLTFPDLESWREHGASASAGVLILSGCADTDDEQPRILRELRQDHKAIPIIICSDDLSASHIRNYLRSGAHGYIPSATPLTVAAEAIRLVLTGGVFVPANVVMSQVEPEAGRKNPLSSFSKREHHIVEALLKGKPNKTIAYELDLSESTVKSHVRSVMRKLHVRSRTEAVVRIKELVREVED
jgi:DNA-binding NarL/FixJ family response regulator